MAFRSKIEDGSREKAKTRGSCYFCEKDSASSFAKATSSGKRSSIARLFQTSAPSAMTMKSPPEPRISSIFAFGSALEIVAAKLDAFGL